MGAEFVRCGLNGALQQVRASELDTWSIGLITDPASGPPLTDCDESVFTEPSWTGYARQDPNPWGTVTTLASDGISAYVDSAVLIFPVESDPGAEVVYGWFSTTSSEPTGEALRAFDYFDSPVIPTEGLPIVILVRIIHRNCAE